MLTQRSLSADCYWPVSCDCNCAPWSLLSDWISHSTDIQSSELLQSSTLCFGEYDTLKYFRTCDIFICKQSIALFTLGHSSLVRTDNTNQKNYLGCFLLANLYYCDVSFIGQFLLTGMFFYWTIVFIRMFFIGRFLLLGC